MQDIQKGPSTWKRGEWEGMNEPWPPGRPQIWAAPAAVPFIALLLPTEDVLYVVPSLLTRVLPF